MEKTKPVCLLAAELNGSLTAGMDLAGISEKTCTSSGAEVKDVKTLPLKFAHMKCAAMHHST